MPTPQEQLDESRRLEQVASKQAGIAPVLGAAGTPLTSEQARSITSADLTPVMAPRVVSPPPEPPPSIAGIKTATPVTPQPQTDIEKSLAEAETAVFGLGTREGELQKRIGTQEIGSIKEIAELNEQIEMNKAEELTLKEKAEKRNVLDPFATGEAARAQKALAIDTLRLSARANALQAKFGIAEKQAKIAIDAEFADKERELRVKRQNIIANFDKMTPAQKKRAEALLLQLDKEDKFVGEQKKVKAEINKQVIEAIKQGAPKGTTDKAFEAGSVEEALGILAPYLKEKEKNQSDFEQAFLRDKGRLPTVQELLNYKKQQAEIVPSKGEVRDSEVSNFLESKKGTDGFTSAGSYQKALRKFIANGGTQTNFLASFPQQTYLRQEEIDKLPAGLKSIQVTPVKTLTADQQSMLNEAKATWDAAKQTYQATPELRQKIIDRAKQLGFDISPYF